MTGTDLAKAAGYRGVLEGRDADPNAALVPELRDGKHRLVWHQDARGGLVELWRRSWGDDIGADDPDWDEHEVSQVYISETQPGVIKAWHLHPRPEHRAYHRAQVDRFICIRGSVLVVTFNLEAWAAWSADSKDAEGRWQSKPGAAVPGPPIVERVLHAERLERIDVPPNVAHGWMALGSEPAWVLNLTSAEYDGSLEFRRGAHDGPAPGIPYDWRRPRDG